MVSLIPAINDDTGKCNIRFLGYGNEQSMKISDLIVSWGEDTRAEQIESAAQNDTDDNTNETDDSLSDIVNVGNSAKKAKFHGYPDKFFNGIMFPPPPPMPPNFSQEGADSDLAAMLMAWYMSGYYTGVYETSKKFKRKSNK